MRTIISMYLILLSIFTISCNQEGVNLPDNDQFSYLDTNQSQNEEIIDKKEIKPLDLSQLKCDKIHTELIGNILLKSVNSQNDINEEKKKVILELTQPYQLKCENNDVIIANFVALKFENEINLDQYIGSTVLSIGEVKKSDNNNNDYPLEMNVIRIEPIKSTMK